MKELLALQNDPPPGMTLNEKSVQNSITQWIVDMEGAPGTLYEGEKFQLLFKFSSRYPFDSPQVMFTGENIPIHPHVYSNGHICLSILTEDWSPALSVQSVCLSIISMLSSCKEKRRPPDNSFYVRTCNKNPKKTKWWYHDDTCWCRCPPPVAEDSPTEKWALWSFSLWTLTFDWKWPIGNEDYFLLLHFYSCAFWAHVDRWFSPVNRHAFISHTVLMQVSGNVNYNSIFYFYFFKLLEKFQVLVYCAITVTSSVVWGRSLPAMDVVKGRVFLTPATWWLMHDRAYEMNLSVVVGL